MYVLKIYYHDVILLWSKSPSESTMLREGPRPLGISFLNFSKSCSLLLSFRGVRDQLWGRKKSPAILLFASAVIGSLGFVSGRDTTPWKSLFTCKRQRQLKQKDCGPRGKYSLLQGIPGTDSPTASGKPRCPGSACSTEMSGWGACALGLTDNE